MPTTARLNYLRIAPRKVRLVADLIRGKSIAEAQNILNFTTKRASLPLLKLLKSALSNAKEQQQLEESALYIKKITVDEGPKYKRWMPRARGAAYQIQKKTSHITLILDATGGKSAKAKKIKKVEKQAEKVKEKKIKKPKVKPEIEARKPKIEKGIRRIFRRKSF